MGSTAGGGRFDMPMRADPIKEALGFGAKLRGAIWPILPMDAIPEGPNAAVKGSTCPRAEIELQIASTKDAVGYRDEDPLIKETGDPKKHAKTHITFIGPEFFDA